MSVRVTVVQHPIASDALAGMRSTSTSNAEFRGHLDRLGIVLLAEATRSLPTSEISVTTPLTTTTGHVLSDTPLVVPVLRAGLGFVSAVQQLFHDVDLGFVGVTRNEATFEPEVYANKLPQTIGDRPVIIVDPMLATGGSLDDVIRLVLDCGATGRIIVVCAISAPEGVAVITDRYGDSVEIDIFTGAMDERLNEHAYIVPGLGDAGDRLFGTPRS